MKNRFLTLTVVFMLIANFSLRADEGMWLPNLIKTVNYGDMQKLGCKLTPEHIYDINHSSMKDAIFQLGNDRNGNFSGFCSGEIISSEGLMITNHHCGYSAISQLSSVEHDYLSDGFWAMSKAEELPSKGLAVSRVVRIEDVSAAVNKSLTSNMDDKARNEAIKNATKSLEEQATKGTHYKARVKEMYAGSEYYLFVYEIFTDVRLVGTPPNSIGKFGGDTDNWMWPRHTGDFCMFRVYMSPDGKPADYSVKNVPYKPLHVLPISLKGIQENDYAMIMGYPGTTDRYISSFGMEFKKSTYNPTVTSFLNIKLNKMKEMMDANAEVRIAWSDNHAGSANGFKNMKGEALNLEKTNAIDMRRAEEQQLALWITQDPSRKAKYGNILSGYDSTYRELSKHVKPFFAANICLLQCSEQISIAQQFSAFQELLKDPKANADKITESTKKLKDGIDNLFKEFFPASDKQVFIAMLNAYAKNLTPAERVKCFDELILKKYKAKTEEQSIQKFADEVYSKSMFTSKERLMAFLNKPSLKALNADVLMNFSNIVAKEVQTTIQPQYLSARKKVTSYEKLFIQAFRDMQPEGKFYPNANSTLRLSYGQVKSYDPYDGAHYKWQTFIEGIIAKMDNNSADFKVPQKLVDLYKKKDYGQYADKDGRMPVAFLTNNDITGGNSGSPVINGNGELIGLAFDGNWEWLTGNLVYNDELQRTICADIRYVLFVIDKYAGAGHLVKEMNVVVEK